MTSMLPIISISALQKGAKSVLASVRDYAVIQSHGKDRAFVLSPALGRLLLESGMLEKLRTAEQTKASASDQKTGKELQDLIGNVLKELSKR